MKCDELKPLMFSITDLAYVDEIRVTKNFQNPHDHAVYKATEVDAAIAELKDELDHQKWRGDEWARNANDKDKQIVELKAKLESVQATAYTESVDAGMENRKLKRALWLARAEWARSAALSYCLVESIPNKDIALTYKRKANRWEKVKAKCLAKAEEYK